MRTLMLLSLIGCPRTVPPPPPAPAADADAIQRPPLDTRDYRIVTLANGLTALVISDPETDMAAAALSVSVGQFSDPPDREGLAHFLEHMLFLGTEKYPDVDGYREFISSHGGRSNAGTGQENTDYHFTVEHAYLEEGLDRFSWFFISPNLDPEYVTREREAVNSEYRLKIQSEARRFREVRRESSNPAHGFAKFSVGNLDTLADREDAPVWDALKSFYDTQYSASRMTLSVIGREDLDTLERWVVERFEAVPTSAAPEEEAVPPHLPDQLGVQINVEPLTEIRRVQLEFPVPSEEPHFREHPLGLLTYLIGQEGEGSLHSVLNERGWITALRSGEDGSSDHGIFVLNIELTESGFAARDEVIDLCFQYFQRIRDTGDLSLWWAERSRVAAINYQFNEPAPPRSAVQQTAWSLHHFPTENVLNSWAIWSGYDHELQQTYLSRLTPDNLRLFVVGAGLPTDQVEARYTVPWSMAPLTDAQRAAWSDGPIDDALQMPVANPYIAAALDLKANASGASAPTKILDEPQLSLWWHQDPSFGVPRSTVRVVLIDPAATADTAARVNARLLTELVADDLGPMRDQLSNASLQTLFAPHSEGLLLQISGYDDKQDEVLTALTQTIADFEIDPERFVIMRDDLVRTWRNTTRERSISQANSALSELMGPTNYTHEDGIAHLQDLTAEDLQTWLDGLRQAVSLQVFVHGNHTAEEATGLARIAATNLTGGAAVAARPEVAIRRIPDGAVLVRDLRVQHDDSALRVVWQGQGTTIDEQARYLMLSNLMQGPFFDELRTQQQLGYVVYAAYSRYDNVPGFTIGIQSSVADAQTLLTQSNAFLVGYEQTLTEMSDEDFDTDRQGLIAVLEEKHSDLYDRTRDFTNDLSLGHSSFDRKARIVTALRTLTRADMLTHLQTRILSPDAGRLVIRTTGESHADVTFEEPGCATHDCILDAMESTFTRAR